MKSRRTIAFRKAFAELPADIQVSARKAYLQWLEDARRPSLHYKRVSDRDPIYSVRVALGWRALAYVEGDQATWFWIGPHAVYERLLKGR